MKLFYLIKKEALQIFRNKTATLMMIIFPIIMIVILSLAFKGSFNVTSSIPKIKISYKIEATNNDYTKNFEKFLETISKELNISTQKIKFIDAEKPKVQDGKISAILHLKADKNIDIITNNLNQQNSDLIKMLVSIYVDTSKTYSTIQDFYPHLMQNIKKLKHNFVNISEVKAPNGISSTDYYSISMFTMIAFYSISSCMHLVLSDYNLGTLKRSLTSATSSQLIILGKLIGGILVTSIQLGILYIFTRFVMKANWGENHAGILIVVFSLIYLSVSIGIGIASAIKNETLLDIASNIIIPIFAFLGGSYIPLATINSNFINTISVISPIKWVNDSLFYIAFGGETNPITTTLLVNICVGSLFLIYAFIINRKKVAI